MLVRFIFEFKTSMTKYIFARAFAKFELNSWRRRTISFYTVKVFPFLGHPKYIFPITKNRLNRFLVPGNVGFDRFNRNRSSRFRRRETLAQTLPLSKTELNPRRVRLFLTAVTYDKSFEGVFFFSVPPFYSVGSPFGRQRRSRCDINGITTETSPSTKRVDVRLGHAGITVDRARFFLLLKTRENRESITKTVP